MARAHADFAHIWSWFRSSRGRKTFCFGGGGLPGHFQTESGKTRGSFALASSRPGISVLGRPGPFGKEALSPQREAVGLPGLGQALEGAFRSRRLTQQKLQDCE